tara:strand:+ start:95 stop:412 length:318 start_codon:yes stop_codon:yes gene_type:complete
MPIIMTARYQVRPHKINQCKQAIKNLVEYVKKNEKDTFYYIASQEILNPYAFIHMMIFKDDTALTMHRSSEAAERFVNIVYPSTIDPIEFKEYKEIAQIPKFFKK